MLEEELSGKIIGAAMEVLNALRPGLDEKLYERALTMELKRRACCFSAALVSGLVLRRINR